MTTKSPKPKDVNRTIIHDKEEQNILTFEKLEPVKVSFFGGLKNHGLIQLIDQSTHPLNSMWMR